MLRVSLMGINNEQSLIWLLIMVCGIFASPFSYKSLSIGFLQSNLAPSCSSISAKEAYSHGNTNRRLLQEYSSGKAQYFTTSYI